MKTTIKLALLLALIVGGKLAKTTEPAALAAAPTVLTTSADTALLITQFSVPATPTAFKRPLQQPAKPSFLWF